MPKRNRDMKIFDEFKQFAIRGNMIDIAIGVIVGAAFNRVIDVLVKEIFLPPLAFLTNGSTWENQKIILREASTVGASNVDEIAVGYGKLFETTIDFIIISFTVFVVVKAMNSLKKRAEDVKDETVATPRDIELLHNIKELIEVQNELLSRK
jgi:large conductance mechanosensitive channel